MESAIFQATPFRRIAAARLAWLQMVKRSPVNLRPFLRVPKGVNAKGIALFAQAELSRFRVTGSEVHKQNAEKLLAMLRSLAISGETKMGEPTKSYGYNFDWQSRAFFSPKGTPTIVPTAFTAKAFVESFQLFGEESDLAFAREICRFVLNDLNTPYRTNDEICFSYTPGDNSLIFNASLLAGETLASIGAITRDGELIKTAVKTARYVIRNQREDGSWTYGPKLRHSWVDNFHTAFVLLSLKRIGENCSELDTETSIKKGLDYWIANFFLEDGAPKYFDSKAFPIDIHSAAAAISTLSEFRDTDERALPLADKVANWTIQNLRDPEGYFYYQKRRSTTVKAPFIRWGQAWMAHALARLIEAKA